MLERLLYIGVMVLTTYVIRVLPFTLIRKPIENRFIRSFLYYVPYVTLAVMTFPSILEVTGSPVAGAIALVIGVVTAFLNLGLLPVAAICCAVVFIAELFL